MSNCSEEKRHEYLIPKNRPIREIEEYHILRIRDPERNTIIFPSNITDYSTNWSVLCIPKHIIEIKPKLGSKFSFNTVDKINNCILGSDVKQEEPFKGKHTIKLKIRHQIDECDYSHCVINLVHVFDTQGTSKSFTKEITREKYQSELIAKKRPKFYKRLREKIRHTYLNELFHFKENDLGIDEFDNGFPEFEGLKKKGCWLSNFFKTS